MRRLVLVCLVIAGCVMVSEQPVAPSPIVLESCGDGILTQSEECEGQGRSVICQELLGEPASCFSCECFPLDAGGSIDMPPGGGMPPQIRLSCDELTVESSLLSTEGELLATRAQCCDSDTDCSGGWRCDLSPGNTCERELQRSCGTCVPPLLDDVPADDDDDDEEEASQCSEESARAYTGSGFSTVSCCRDERDCLSTERCDTTSTACVGAGPGDCGVCLPRCIDRDGDGLCRGDDCDDDDPDVLTCLAPWDDDSIVLLRDPTTGELGCFGCGVSACRDPPAEMIVEEESDERHCEGFTVR